MADFTNDVGGILLEPIVNYGGATPDRDFSNLGCNPLRVTNPGTIISDGVSVSAMEWVDDDSTSAGPIEAGDNLKMTINGDTVGINAVAAETKPWGIQLYTPIDIDTLSVESIDSGTLLIWLAG